MLIRLLGVAKVITNYILNLLLDVKMTGFSLLPTLSTPLWAYENFPKILQKIAGFNYYLPILELIGLVVSVLTMTLAWKIGKIIIGIGGFIDLNK